jgi:hypothetical protein
MADGVIRWQSETGQKIAYWGGTAHTAVHRPEATPASTPTWHTEGTYLRDHFGPDYVSIALTFDRGRALWDVAPCSSELAEAVLREVEMDAFGLDLRGQAPQAVLNAETLATKRSELGSGAGSAGLARSDCGRLRDPRAHARCGVRCQGPASPCGRARIYVKGSATEVGCRSPWRRSTGQGSATVYASEVLGC